MRSVSEEDEHLNHGGLLWRMLVAVRTEWGSNITPPELRAESREPDSRRLREALVFAGQAPTGRPAGTARCRALPPEGDDIVQVRCRAGSS